VGMLEMMVFMVVEGGKLVYKLIRQGNTVLIFEGEIWDERYVLMVGLFGWEIMFI